MAKKVRRSAKIATRVKTAKVGARAGGASLNPEVDLPDPTPGDDDDDGPDGVGSKRRVRGRRSAAQAVGDIQGNDDDLEEALEGIGGATGRAVARRGDFQDDGYEGEGQSRSAFDDYLRDHIQADAARFEALRQQGVRDEFNPDAAPPEVEKRGHFATANHVVRLFEQWLLESPSRDDAVSRASSWLASLQRPDSVRKVLAELEAKPIRDVYPLEVMLRLLEQHPHKLPGVLQADVLSRQFAARAPDGIHAGHPFLLQIPDDMRIKAFAQLGGGRPGYEFFPSPKAGHYTFLVDTPGEWDFALLAVRTQKLGKMDRELPGGFIDRFRVRVTEMGKKPAAEETPAR